MEKEPMHDNKAMDTQMSKNIGRIKQMITKRKKNKKAKSSSKDMKFFT